MKPDNNNNKKRTVLMVANTKRWLSSTHFIVAFFSSFFFLLLLFCSPVAVVGLLIINHCLMSRRISMAALPSNGLATCVRPSCWMDRQLWMADGWSRGFRFPFRVWFSFTDGPIHYGKSWLSIDSEAPGSGLRHRACCIASPWGTSSPSDWWIR